MIRFNLHTPSLTRPANSNRHQLVPFGKTEQACISYKHIDKAIEQAKHKLKFREFVKLRNKPAQPDGDDGIGADSGGGGGGGGPPQAAPPPSPPLDVLHTSLEPPEDLVAAIGEINMAATQIIADQFDLSNDELLNGLPLIDMTRTNFWPICPLMVKPIRCDPTGRFRSFTGHCNNHDQPTWGASHTPYVRYLAPKHPDGIEEFRRSVVDEAPLPPARLVSARVHRDADQPSNDLSLFIMVFGQIVDHELTQAAPPRGE